MNFTKYHFVFSLIFLNLELTWHVCVGSTIAKKVGTVFGCDGAGGSLVSNPLEIGMSQGFISAATSSIGQHVCNNDGTCKSIPLACNQSSCCSLTYNTSFPIQTPNLYSNCGCFDSSRKICKPLKAFRLDTETCNKSDGTQVSSKFELAQRSGSDFSCKDSGSSVELNVDNESGDIQINIKSQFCLPRGKHNERDVVGNVVGEVENVVKRRRCGIKFPAAASGFDVSKYNRSNIDHSKALQCENSVDKNTISISPGFIPFGESNSFLNSDVTFKVRSSDCAKNGQVVQRKLAVRLPSDEENNCKNGKDTLWSTSSVNFENKGNGILSVIVDTRQCVLSSGAKTVIFEFEEHFKVEMHIGQFEKELDIFETQIAKSC